MKKLTALLIATCIGVGSFPPAGAMEPAKQKDDPQEYVRSLPYAWGVAEPALEAFRTVARERGWTQQSIDAWLPFVEAVMKRESGWCPNLRRGARIREAGVSCEVTRQGRGSDSGFFQVISIHYKPGKWLCNQEGICSANAIVTDPWASMVAGVALIERAGKQPWCYTKKLQRSKVCRLAP